MAKSKRRQAMAAVQAQNSASWKTMTPEARKEWSARRIRTAKSGFAKRARERAAGRPMAARTDEGIGRRFVAPHSRPCAEFGPWLRDFWRQTTPFSKQVPA